MSHLLNICNMLIYVNDALIYATCLSVLALYSLIHPQACIENFTRQNIVVSQVTYMY